MLGYGAFDGFCILRDQAARLTQPTLDALEQGAQVLAPAHGTQEQDIFAEGGVTERVRACWLRDMG